MPETKFGMSTYRRTGRALLSLFMFSAGIMHFVATDRFAMIVPHYLPTPRLLVQISGLAEIGLALALLAKPTRKWAGLGLIALYFAVLPANIHMATSSIQPFDFVLPDWALWARIPFQLVFIYWAWAVSRD